MKKICKVCGEEKLLCDFYSAKGTKDGKRGKCKICCNLQCAKRHKEKIDDRKEYRKK